MTIVAAGKIKLLSATGSSKNDLGILRNGELVSDEEFDLIYSDFARQLSSCQWTPVAVAFAAARLLVRDRVCKVLDVGSGVGKFCQIAASVAPGTFVGVEQRARLVAHAVTSRADVTEPAGNSNKGSRSFTRVPTSGVLSTWTRPPSSCTYWKLS